MTVDGIRAMGDDAIVFAMANPTPEIAPEEIEGMAAVVGTGRSDYPNQINNVLAFPGVFRGALDVRATAITREMELAAAHALAAAVDREHLEPDYVIPSVFDKRVSAAVSAAVSEARANGRRGAPGARRNGRRRVTETRRVRTRRRLAALISPPFGREGDAYTGGSAGR